MQLGAKLESSMRSCCRGSSFRRAPQTSPSLATSNSSDVGILRCSQRYNLSTWTWICPLASSHGGHAWNNSLERVPGCIFTRCLNNLKWFLSMQRSSGYSRSPSWKTELLTLSSHPQGRNENWLVDGELCLLAQILQRLCCSVVLSLLNKTPSNIILSLTEIFSSYFAISIRQTQVWLAHSFSNCEKPTTRPTEV